MLLIDSLWMCVCVCVWLSTVELWTFCWRFNSCVRKLTVGRSVSCQSHVEHVAIRLQCYVNATYAVRFVLPVSRATISVHSLYTEISIVIRTGSEWPCWNQCLIGFQFSTPIYNWQLCWPWVKLWFATVTLQPENPLHPLCHSCKYSWYAHWLFWKDKLG